MPNGENIFVISQTWEELIRTNSCFTLSVYHSDVRRSLLTMLALSEKPPVLQEEPLNFNTCEHLPSISNHSNQRRIEARVQYPHAVSALRARASLKRRSPSSSQSKDREQRLKRRSMLSEEIHQKMKLEKKMKKTAVSSGPSPHKLSHRQVPAIATSQRRPGRPRKHPSQRSPRPHSLRVTSSSCNGHVSFWREGVDFRTSGSGWILGMRSSSTYKALHNRRTQQPASS